MPLVPLPFVVALLLAVLFVQMARLRQSNTSSRLFLAFVGVCTIQAAVAGLHWGYGFPLTRIIQPILASTIPPLAWVGFCALSHPDWWIQRTGWRHGLPVAAVILLVMVWPEPVDYAVAAVFLSYGTALLWLGRAGPDALGAVRIGDGAKAHRALVVTGALLIGSGLLDLAIAADLRHGDGAHAAAIVAAGNLVLLVIVSFAASAAGNSRPEPEQETSAVEVTSPAPSTGEVAAEDTRVLATVDRLMADRELFRDPNLTLDRLARRARIPSRRISGAINRVHGHNVSQFVNAYRIATAVRLLEESKLPVTMIMFEVGFQTKSNFNREFRRVTGMSPSNYRQASTT